MNAKEKLLEMQNKENECKQILVDLKKERRKVLDEYYIYKCGDKYSDIENTLKDFDKYLSNQGVYYKLDKEMKKIVTSTFNNVVSKKIKTGKQYKKETWRKGYYHTYDIVLGSYGLGLDSYGRARRIESLTEYINILKDVGEIEKFVWKKHKKEAIKVIRENIADWEVKDVDTKRIPFKKTIDYETDSNIYTLKSKSDFDEVILNINKYSFSIHLGRYYPRQEVYIGGDVTPYNCYMAYQLWDILEDPLKEIIKINKLNYETNKEIFDKIVEDAGHCLVCEKL